MPLVGYIPFMNSYDPEYPFKGLMKMAEEYGPVAAFYMGPSKVFISVCGFEAVQEALRNPDLDGRYENATFKERSFGEKLGKKIICIIVALMRISLVYVNRYYVC